MMVWRNKIIFLILSFWLSSINLLISAAQVTGQNDDSEQVIADDFDGLNIRKIILQREHANHYVTDAIIYNSIPYQAGDVFKLSKTTHLIKKLYQIGKPFGYFDQVLISAEQLNDQEMNLVVTTYEKPVLIDIQISGQDGVSEKDIRKALNADNIHALSENDLPIVIKKIQKLYRTKDYHFVQVKANLEFLPSADQSPQASLVIKIDEGRQSKVRRILFEGNHHVPAKRLRGVMFTREDWLFSAMNKAGSYRPENLVADKHFIKSYYKSHGYFMANIADIKTQIDERTNQIDITIVVDEGDLYTVDKVQIEGGSEELSNDFLLAHLPVQKGKLYSEKDVRDAIEALRMIWGEYGYAFIEVNPATVPNMVNKTVDLTFYIDLGHKVHVNRINIIGNQKTRDKVIRRQLSIAEGDLLTLMRMDISKNKVLQMGYFDVRDGVNWKMHRIDNDWADLDLILKEKKTGRSGINMGYGGGAQSMSASNSFRIGAEVYDTNVLGYGYLLKLAGEWSKDAWSITTIGANPRLFDRPILGKVDFHVTRSDYDDELRNVRTFNEQRIGGGALIGFVLNPSRLRETSIELELSFDDIRFSNRPQVNTSNQTQAVALLQSFLDKRFIAGGVLVFGSLVRQDFRNSSQHPSSGYQWTMIPRLGLGVGNNDIGYAKCDLDASWYTPLIGEHDLVFGLHGHFGAVSNLGIQQIPYREMFHVGGPTSVRGYLYGQIGPSIQTGTKTDQMSSIGSTRAFFVNAELIFPITANMSMKGAFFYDGGAGWHTPGYNRLSNSDQLLIKNNNFDFRHAIGFGIRMLEPQPLKIDWGLKLDPRPGESHTEVHFSAYREF